MSPRDNQLRQAQDDCTYAAAHGVSYIAQWRDRAVRRARNSLDTQALMLQRTGDDFDDRPLRHSENAWDAQKDSVPA